MPIRQLPNDQSGIDRLAAGDDVRLYCRNCQSEYEVTLEPKINEMDNPEQAQKARKSIEHRTPMYCPFCFGIDLEVA